MNSFIGKIHLTQDKLMSVEMWYVDATPWYYPIRYADSFVSPGGGSGIRTHDTVSRIHAFQACAFSHSAIPPAGETRNIARRVRQTTGDVRGARGWTKAVADTMIEPDTDGRHRDRAQHRYLASISPPELEMTKNRPVKQ